MEFLGPRTAACLVLTETGLFWERLCRFLLPPAGFESRVPLQRPRDVVLPRRQQGSVVSSVMLICISTVTVSGVPFLVLWVIYLPLVKYWLEYFGHFY